MRHSPNLYCHGRPDVIIILDQVTFDTFKQPIISRVANIETSYVTLGINLCHNCKYITTKHDIV